MKERNSLQYILLFCEQSLFPRKRLLSVINFCRRFNIVIIFLNICNKRLIVILNAYLSQGELHHAIFMGKFHAHCYSIGENACTYFTVTSLRTINSKKSWQMQIHVHSLLIN